MLIFGKYGFNDRLLFWKQCVAKRTELFMFQVRRKNIMKYLQMFLAMIVMVGVLVCTTSQSVLAQDLTEETTDLITYDEIMSYFFGDEYDLIYGNFDSSDSGVSAQVAATTKPLVPTNVIPIHNGRNEVFVMWDHNDAVIPAGFKVYFGSTLKADIKALTSDYNSRTTTISSVSAGTYSVSVSAYNDAGESAKSSAKSVTVTAPTTPPTLSSVVQTSSVSNGSANVKFDWSYCPGATTYAIYRQTAGTWTKVWSGFGTYTGDSYIITGVTATVSIPVGTHYFAVTAKNPNETAKGNSVLKTIQ
jgi:cytoskeletal protein RodZ